MALFVERASWRYRMHLRLQERLRFQSQCGDTLRAVSIWSSNASVYLPTSQFEALVSPFLTTGRYTFRSMFSNCVMSLSDQNREVVCLISSPALAQEAPAHDVCRTALSKAWSECQRGMSSLNIQEVPLMVCDHLFMSSMAFFA
jgi:hypothetical protein